MKLSIIVPCRNERAHIRRFLENVRRLELPLGADYEVLIADGGSDDGTREILEEESERVTNLTILSNPERFVAAGLNRAIRCSHGEIIIRLDVHTHYARDYLVECVNALEQTGASNVGGPWIARGRCRKSRAIALTFQSWIVSGGGKAHDPSYEGLVDTVYLGCWRRETLEELGLFDERMVRAQDSELNLRIIRAGGRIWQTPMIRSWYEPRGSYRDLFRQYAQYGYWKAVTLRTHRLPASLRQLVPPLFVLGIVACLATAWLGGPTSTFSMTAICSYFVTVCLAAVRLCMPFKAVSSGTVDKAGEWPVFVLVLAAIPVYHFGYGLGYLRGIFDQFILRIATPPALFAQLTRTSTADRRTSPSTSR